MQQLRCRSGQLHLIPECWIPTLLGACGKELHQVLAQHAGCDEGCVGTPGSAESKDGSREQCQVSGLLACVLQASPDTQGRATGETGVGQPDARGLLGADCAAGHEARGRQGPR